MNAGVIYTSRKEIEVYHFSLVVTLGIPFLALFLQAYVPVALHGHLRFFSIFDLPLVVAIFFAVARRNPVAGLLTGSMIGLAQDALSTQYLGLFGIAKTVVCYAASSIGAKIDVENPITRFLLTSGFYLLQRTLYLIVQRGLVGENPSSDWLYHLGAALANGLLAIVVFSLLDRLKRRT
jgi:rod shape-determining protein MreD